MKRGPAPVSNPMIVKNLVSEISRLSEQQTDALHGAAFVRMTETEERACEQRRKKLRELVRELEVLASRRAA
ncbi:MAG TPA: hypothetical protein VJQ59_13345 [Candidatus Sulfotelmatobacter sp.]|nr:hypothetical protein [Candidatus Sulfotelmatobacter sp.]